MSTATQYIQIAPERGSFRVNRKTFVDPDIFKREQDHVFGQCWLYVGHESELKKPNSYLTRTIAGRPLIFVRSSSNEMRCFINVCPHRGAQIVRDRDGKAKNFTCIYHGWSWNNDGELVHIQGDDGFHEKFNACGEVNLEAVPRLESYRGLYFISFKPDIMPLDEYLAGAKEYIDIMMDQSAEPMEVVGGTHEYSIRCNWKGLAENSIDIYHGPNTHPSYVDYLLNQMPGVVPDLETAQGHVTSLGNGHGVAEYYGPWGRPVADWKPSLGEGMRAEIDEKEREVVGRVGAERAERINKRSFNLLIFPNLVLLDIHALCIRSFQPVRPDYMDSYMWMIAPTSESPEMREIRLRNFLEFLGPGGFAHPDDIEALETCQVSFELSKFRDTWNEVSKGIPREGNEDWMDEGHMRAFWRRWNELMTQGDN